jgi:hypothetical protein
MITEAAVKAAYARAFLFVTAGVSAAVCVLLVGFSSPFLAAICGCVFWLIGPLRRRED